MLGRGRGANLWLMRAKDSLLWLATGLCGEWGKKYANDTFCGKNIFQSLRFHGTSQDGIRSSLMVSWQIGTTPENVFGDCANTLNFRKSSRKEGFVPRRLALRPVSGKHPHHGPFQAHDGFGNDSGRPAEINRYARLQVPVASFQNSRASRP